MGGSAPPPSGSPPLNIEYIVQKIIVKTLYIVFLMKPKTLYPC